MSLTKTAYDHSYYYLQRAKELYLSDWKAWERGEEIITGKFPPVKIVLVELVSVGFSTKYFKKMSKIRPKHSDVQTIFNAP